MAGVYLIHALQPTGVRKLARLMVAACVGTGHHLLLIFNAWGERCSRIRHQCTRVYDRY